MDEIYGSYHYGILALTIGISLFGSYIALDISQHLVKTRTGTKGVWMLIGSLVMALTVWAFHYISLAALRMPAPIHYSWPLTFFSIVPMMVASWTVFYSVTRDRLRWIILSTVVIGAGVSSMVLLGLKAVHIEGVHVEFDYELLFFTFIYSMLASWLVLYIYKRVQLKFHIQYKVLYSLVLVILSIGIHYLGVKSLSFYDIQGVTEDIKRAPGNETLLIITVVVVLMIMLTIVVLFGRVESRSSLQMAYYDHLTSLPNRRYFIKVNEEEVERAKKQQECLACVLIDVDHFKWVNDTFGYEAGDEFLRQVAKRIQNYLQPHQRLARLDGNRFGVLTHSKLCAEELEGYLCGLQIQFQSIPFEYERFQFKSTISIGASVLSFEKRVEDNLIMQAEQALHYAKVHGRNNVQVYNQTLHDRARENLILSHLQHALEKDEFLLHYQPKMDVVYGVPYQAEVLLRWNNSELGSVSPAEFIPIAERNGLIVEITEWVIAKALQQLQEWKQLHIPLSNLAINISPVHFQYGHVYSMMKKLLMEYDVQPESIELEITETSVMKDIEEAVRTLEMLRDLGVRIALDDFGTGLSSLNYLQRLPIDTLKIDRSFIQEIEQDRKKQSIVKSIIQLAKDLGFSVTAEGVETEKQVELLVELGCDNLQGFYYYKPMCSESVERQLIVATA
ncbi:hypothetical protein N781_00980 [Pontibacillus halophilus JSM 076056 = DSM 19796]|uniref:Diguanylate cyclase n=1 Tax=Pontibacillus halophilus JSM 076056 = DSM 19796 TaxID=1385510 RepID=A0A0A5GQ40_9BACI|nr:EAL domain-containing protein [Pontibacillus halophilus]KGX94064.1 hypothetical protein N781_00980 [Pontibacillus halophilus JSM 076056 = DSM 19796]